MDSTGEAGFDVAACRAHLEARQRRQFQAREDRRLTALRALRGAARAVLPRFPRVRRAYLFGSVLRPGALRSTSDVDVAFEGELNAEEYFALWRALERAAPDWVIDLVDLSRDVRFADLIREHGELIYGRPDSNVEGEHSG
jgi:predicted nucleotidyltransferase